MAEQKQHPGQKREKFYTVSARLVFSTILIILLLALIVGASIVINKGPISPLLGVIPLVATPSTYPAISQPATGNNSGYNTATTVPIIVSVTCSPTSPVYGCINPTFNTTTGNFTVAIKQVSGYDWIRVTVQFVPKNAVYASTGVPELSWSPPEAVNVTGGLLNNTVRYINIPITSGPVGVGTNITGSIWAKYQLGEGKPQFYANMSSAVIQVKRAS